MTSYKKYSDKNVDTIPLTFSSYLQSATFGDKIHRDGSFLTELENNSTQESFDTNLIKIHSAVINIFHVLCYFSNGGSRPFCNAKQSKWLPTRNIRPQS